MSLDFLIHKFMYFVIVNVNLQFISNLIPKFYKFSSYEAIKRPDDIGYRYILAGYSSVVNFYCHPFMVRTRIAQFLVLPQYRGKGNGSRFLQSIYNDLISRKEVKDVTGSFYYS